MATSFDPVVSVSVTNAVIKTFGSTDTKLTKVLATIQGERSKSINLMLDAFWVACDKPKDIFLKGNAATNPARAQVKGVFDAIVEAGHLTKATAATYQTCFWIAFMDGVAWTPDLANKKTEGKKPPEDGDGAGGGKTPPTGTTQSTTRTDLDKTLTKALAQARLLGLTDFAADMLDLCLDRLDNFQETVLAKK
jgi:hypothetical protein